MGSYSQSFEYTCARCGQAGECDVWLVVDVSERPDLAALIRTRRLRSHRCDACGGPVEIDVSLLTGRPQGPQALLFSPARSADPAGTDAQLRMSVTLLMNGSTGGRPIPPDGLITVPLDVLDVAVDRDLRADLGQAATGRFRAASGPLQRYAGWLAHEARENRRRTLIPLLVRLLEAGDLQECRGLIEATRCCSTRRSTNCSPRSGRSRRRSARAARTFWPTGGCCCAAAGRKAWRASSARPAP
jgi:hypothetical protein